MKYDCVPAMSFAATPLSPNEWWQSRRFFSHVFLNTHWSEGVTLWDRKLRNSAALDAIVPSLKLGFPPPDLGIDDRIPHGFPSGCKIILTTGCIFYKKTRLVEMKTHGYRRNWVIVLPTASIWIFTWNGYNIKRYLECFSKNRLAFPEMIRNNKESWTKSNTKNILLSPMKTQKKFHLTKILKMNMPMWWEYPQLLQEIDTKQKMSVM